MSDQFLAQQPKGFDSIEGAHEWARAVSLSLNDLLRPGGTVATVDATALTTLSQADQITTLTTSLNDTITALDNVITSLPTYTITNDSTDRSLNANAAVSGTGIDVADAGPANVALLSDHDALVAVVQGLADVVATLVKDLAAKSVLGT